MFSGNIAVFYDRKIVNKELSASSIDYFKPLILDIFKLEGWDISSAKFQKSGFGSVYTFDEMHNSDFVFGTVRVFLKLNI
jgi:hypothetical protein